MVHLSPAPYQAAIGKPAPEVVRVADPVPAKVLERPLVVVFSSVPVKLLGPQGGHEGVSETMLSRSAPVGSAVKRTLFAPEIVLVELETTDTCPPLSPPLTAGVTVKPGAEITTAFEASDFAPGTW